MRLSPQTERAMLKQGELGTLLKIYNDSLWDDSGQSLTQPDIRWAHHQHKVIGTLVFMSCFALGLQLGAWLDQLA